MLDFVRKAIRREPETFIELIFDAEGKYANWNPDVEIRVGDYGVVDKVTGSFRRAGNIYADDIILNTLPDIDKYRPIVGESTGIYEATGGSARSAGITASVRGDSPADTEVLFEGSWGFTKKRGAVFVMRNAIVTSIPTPIPDDILEQLMDIHKLKGMGIVTSVWKCSGYVRYLSTKGSDNISVKLVADAPLPHIPMIFVGANISAHWECKRGEGFYKEAHPKGEPIYSGMYVLKMNERTHHRHYTASGLPPEEDAWAKLANYQPPWEDDEDVEEDDDDFDDDGGDVGEEQEA